MLSQGMDLEKGRKNEVERLAKQTRKAMDKCIKTVFKKTELPIPGWNPIWAALPSTAHKAHLLDFPGW